MMATDTDLSWVRFVKHDDSLQCEGFAETLGECPNEAVWVVYAKTECPDCQKTTICQLCFDTVLTYINIYRLQCSHGSEAEVTHWERIPR